MMNIEITKSTKELTKVESVKIARSKTALSLDEVSKERQRMEKYSRFMLTTLLYYTL